MSFVRDSLYHISLNNMFVLLLHVACCSSHCCRVWGPGKVTHFHSTDLQAKQIVRGFTAASDVTSDNRCVVDSCRLSDEHVYGKVTEDFSFSLFSMHLLFYLCYVVFCCVVDGSECTWLSAWVSTCCTWHIL